MNKRGLNNNSKAIGRKWARAQKWKYYRVEELVGNWKRWSKDTAIVSKGHANWVPTLTRKCRSGCSNHSKDTQLQKAWLPHHRHPLGPCFGDLICQLHIFPPQINHRAHPPIEWPEIFGNFRRAPFLCSSELCMILTWCEWVKQYQLYPRSGENKDMVSKYYWLHHAFQATKRGVNLGQGSDLLFDRLIPDRVLH